jgi:hypothetical protein
MNGEIAATQNRGRTAKASAPVAATAFKLSKGLVDELSG